MLLIPCIETRQGLEGSPGYSHLHDLERGRGREENLVLIVQYIVKTQIDRYNFT
jgi:hypothetical protein